MTLQQQIAELPDACEMFRQVTELDPLAVVPVGFTSQELKALINELTEKVERLEPAAKLAMEYLSEQCKTQPFSKERYDAYGALCLAFPLDPICEPNCELCEEDRRDFESK